MSPAVDFNVIRHFRSITLLSDASRSGVERLVDIDLFLDWLARYDVWFKTCVVAGDQLALMYNRSLSLTASRIAQDAPHVVRIATAAKALGLGPLVQVVVSDAIACSDELLRMLAAGGIGTLFLDAADSSAVDLAACAQLVRRLAPTGVALILYGTAEFWVATGVLGTPELNGVSFQLLPIRRRAGAPAGIETHRKGLKLLPPDSAALIAPHTFNPCAHRFQLFVAPDGLIYPCHALIGLVALGHIEDPVGAEMFEGTLNWKALGACGPSVAPEAKDHEDGNEALPLACRSHVRQLQAISEGLPL